MLAGESKTVVTAKTFCSHVHNVFMTSQEFLLTKAIQLINVIVSESICKLLQKNINSLFEEANDEITPISSNFR